MAYRRSKALRDFQRGIGRPRNLLSLESKLPDPPTVRLRVKSESLRGGAIVLVSATFEAYLKEALAEYVERISKKIPHSNDPRLPLKFVHHNDLGYLPYLKSLKKADMYLELKSHASLIASNGISTKSFDKTNSNADSACVERMLENLGVRSIWAQIELEFGQLNNAPLPQTLIKNKLDSYLNWRNEVAHNGTASNLTRIDLQGAIKFYQTLGESIDLVLYKFVSNL